MTTEQRLDRLERQNRRLRTALSFVVVVLLGGGLLALRSQDSVPDVLKAKAVQVVDKDGNVLVNLASRTFAGDTWGYIETMTPEAQKLVSIDTTGSFDSVRRVGAINTYHYEGKPLVSIGADFGGDNIGTVGGLRTYNGGTPMVSLGSTLDGGGYVTTIQMDGQRKGQRRRGSVAGMGVQNGAGFVTTTGPKKGTAVWIGANKDGEAYISTWGRVSESSVLPFVIMSRKDGAGVVGVRNPSGELDFSELLVPMTGQPEKPWQWYSTLPVAD